MESLNKLRLNQSPLFSLALTSVFMSNFILAFGVYSGEGWQILGGLQKHAGQLDVLLQEILGGGGLSTTRQGWTTVQPVDPPGPIPAFPNLAWTALSLQFNAHHSWNASALPRNI